MKPHTSHLSLHFLMLLLMVQPFVSAQKNQMKFGKIDPQYFEMKEYSADTAAEALILGDYGQSIIEYDPIDGFVMKHTRHFRAKIFNQNGYYLATHNNILYDFEGVSDKVTLFKGCVYNMENGKVVESRVEKSMINEEQIDRRHSNRKFTFPNVKEGSIVEFEIAIKSNYFDLPDWNFQYQVPALFSEYYVAYPEYFQYKVLQKGFLMFTVNNSSSRTVSFSVSNIQRPGNHGGGGSVGFDKYDYLEKYQRYRIDNVPAFRTEPYMNALSNYVSCIEFEISAFRPPYGIERNFTKTWENINKELLDDEDFGLQLKRSGFLKDIAATINSTATEKEQKMIQAFELVRNTMKWNDLNRYYVSRDIQKCWESKSGSSAEVNLILVTLLKELGLDAEPVIISTRNNGMIHPAQIMLGQFNYVLASVLIGDKSFLLDATEKYCPYNMLTPRCINGQGRVISASRPGWIDLNSSTRYERTTVINASILPDGTIKGQVQNLFGNYAALDKRIEISSSKDIEEYQKSLEDDYTGLEVINYKNENIEKLDLPLNETMEVEIRDAGSVAGNLITLTPVLFREWDYNPFRLEQRKFPVDYIYPHLIKDVITYILPEGYTIDERPKDMILTMPENMGKFIFRLGLNGNSLQLMSTLEISKSLFTTEDYSVLKDFYNAMVQKQAEKIVLKKTI